MTLYLPGFWCTATFNPTLSIAHHIHIPLPISCHPALPWWWWCYQDSFVSHFITPNSAIVRFLLFDYDEKQRTFIVNGGIGGCNISCLIELNKYMVYVWCGIYRFNSSLVWIPSSSRTGANSSRYCLYWPSFSTFSLTPSKMRTAVA